MAAPPAAALENSPSEEKRRQRRRRPTERDDRLADGQEMLQSLLRDDVHTVQRTPIFPIDGMPGVNEDHVKAAFQEIDFDHNEHVGVNELRYLLTIAGDNPTDEELDEMISMLDDDGDGQVNYEEFLSLFAHDSIVLAQMLAMRPEALSA